MDRSGTPRLKIRKKVLRFAFRQGLIFGTEFCYRSPRLRMPSKNREDADSMDYLVHCECGHDLASHREHGCRARSDCACRRTKLEALDSAIAIARGNPWAAYERTVSKATPFEALEPPA